MKTHKIYFLVTSNLYYSCKHLLLLKIKVVNISLPTNVFSSVETKPDGRLRLRRLSPTYIQEYNG